MISPPVFTVRKIPMQGPQEEGTGCKPLHRMQRVSYRAAIYRNSRFGMSVMRKMRAALLPTTFARTLAYDGQRCALLTMKSRNTWTRATDFNSSG